MTKRYEDRPIAMYLHCGQCLKENARPQDIAAGISHDGECIVIWCNRHEREVATLPLLEPMEGLRCEACEAGRPHRH